MSAEMRFSPAVTVFVAMGFGFLMGVAVTVLVQVTIL